MLDSPIPGVRLVAASGHDDGSLAAPPVSAVPEAMLMLAGLAALGGLRRSSTRAGRC